MQFYQIAHGAWYGTNEGIITDIKTRQALKVFYPTWNGASQS